MCAVPYIYSQEMLRQPQKQHETHEKQTLNVAGCLIPEASSALQIRGQTLPISHGKGLSRHAALALSTQGTKKWRTSDWFCTTTVRQTNRNIRGSMQVTDTYRQPEHAADGSKVRARDGKTEKNTGRRSEGSPLRRMQPMTQSRESVMRSFRLVLPPTRTPAAT